MNPGSKNGRKHERAACSVWYANDIIATLRQSVLVLDRDLRVQSANPTFYSAFAVSPEETEDHLLFDLGNGQWDIPGLRKLLDNVISRNEPVDDYEADHTFPQLGRRIMLLDARPFPPDSMFPELILLSIQDVTDHREALLRELADELAEIDRRKDQFLATLAHELRNPLAPIRSGLEAIQLSGMERRVIQTASSQVVQMARLVDDLIDVSRINRGEIELRRERTDLTAAARHAVQAIRTHCNEVNLELTITHPSARIHVYADPVRMEQVVGNLLTNACQFTEEGGHVSLAVETDGEFAVIRVQDTGIGIPPELLSRVFDPFIQAGTAMGRTKKGLGIGLALVKHLVEQHDGTIEVRSAGVGQGSEFTVRLPLAGSPGGNSLGSVAGEPITPASGRILIVDDNRDAATSLAVLLGFVGYETHTVFGGYEAIDAVPRIRPHAIVLDIGMPEVDGLEVCRRVRQQSGGDPIVIIAVSEWGHDEVRKRSRDAGFDGHLVKPVEFTALAKMLSDLLPNET